MNTYRLGSLITGNHPHIGMSYPRPLIDDETDETVAIVDSCAGPVLMGHMTAAQVAKEFPGAL